MGVSGESAPWMREPVRLYAVWNLLRGLSPLYLHGRHPASNHRHGSRRVSDRRAQVPDDMVVRIVLCLCRPVSTEDRHYGCDVQPEKGGHSSSPLSLSFSNPGSGPSILPRGEKPRPKFGVLGGAGHGPPFQSSEVAFLHANRVAALQDG